MAVCGRFPEETNKTAEVRLQLGYHVAGFKMLHTYSRDAAAQPLMELARVLRAIGEGTFFPDVTRSGRFLEPPSSELTGNVVRARIETAVIDLEMKEESVDLTSEVIPTSSSESSAEEFQTENRGGLPSSGAS